MNRLATVLASATLASAALLATSANAQDGPYKVLATTKVGGPGGMDYVFADSDARKLYVARSGPEGHVAVFDLDTLKQVGDIPKVSAHGATVDAKYGHGITASKPVNFFDAKTFAIIKTLDVQGNPDGYLTDPSDDHMYILSHSAPNVTVIDAKDGAILGTIDLGGAPEQAASDGKGHLYIDLEDKDAIAVVDTKTMKMTGKYDVKSHGGGCAGLAMDVKNDILFATCRDKSNMIILSAKDGTILADLPTGKGSDGATFNPKTMEAFSSQGDGTLTIVKENSPTSFVVEQTVKTPLRAKTLTLDSKTGKIFLITAEYTPAPPAEPGQRPGRPTMVPDSFMIITVGK
jgi:DNA-binding beta-propeller fold protein YncE